MHLDQIIQTNFLETITLKILTSSLLLPILLASGCKVGSSNNDSITAAASNSDEAFESIYPENDNFCLTKTGENEQSCENLLLKFMNSAKFEGKKLLITCGTTTETFVYDPNIGGGGTFTPETLDRLRNLIRKRNNNKVAKSCQTGVRDV